MAVFSVRSVPRARLAAAMLGAAVLAGCAGTPSVSKPSTVKSDVPPGCDIGGGVINPTPACVAKLGKITLQEADVEGSNQPAQDQLNSAFMAKYPNIKVVRLKLNYDQWVTDGKVVFALSNNQAPDVMEADSSDPSYGKLIKSGLLLDLDKYDRAWGWSKKLAPNATVPQRLDPSLTHPGTGSLYGLSPTLTMTGYYYNKKLMAQLGASPPATLTDFFGLLAKAKARGLLPIQGGDRSGRNVAVFDGEMFEAATLPTSVWSGLSYGGLKSASELNNGGLTAAMLMKRIVPYLSPGYLGYDDPTAFARFTHGQGLLYANGNWAAPALVKQMGDNVGFFLLPASRPGPRATWFGQNNPWMIPTASKHPSAAAVYLNFLASPEAARIYAGNDQIPALPLAPSQVPHTVSPVGAEILQASSYVARNNSGRPWPVTIDLPGSALAKGYQADAEVQRLMAGQVTPQQWLAGFETSVKEDIAAAQGRAQGS